MIYTAPYVMRLMRANPLRGQVGEDWALENQRDCHVRNTYIDVQTLQAVHCNVQ
jgi:hypothetical protein